MGFVIFSHRNMNALYMKSYPKSTKIDAFEQKICIRLNAKRDYRYNKGDS